jgi:hypothetical protein
LRQPFIVHAQSLDGSSAAGGLANDPEVVIAPGKVIMPDLGSWMK